MPDDTVTLVSTTDSPEQVKAALTGAVVEEPKPAATPAPPAAPPAAETPAEAAVEEAEAPPANETPEQKTDREARQRGLPSEKRQQRIKNEIDALTRSKHELRFDVEAEQARLNDLRQRREDLERQLQPATPPLAVAPGTAPGAGVPGHPEPKLDAVDEQGNAKFATYEDYLSAHAVWTREEAVFAARTLIEQEKQAERERIDYAVANRGVQERLAAYNAELATFKQGHADFDATFEDAKDAVRETLLALGPQALKVVDGYTVFDAEDGPALTYYLLKRPDELKAIVMKSPPQQIAHLARLEERLRPAAVKKPGPVAVTVPETRAPAPIKPVGAGPTATSVPLEDESYQDYKVRRERELRARGGR